VAGLRNVYRLAVLLCNFTYFQLRIYTDFCMSCTIHRMLHNLKHGLAIRALVTDQVRLPFQAGNHSQTQPRRKS
jgi:hypothetical protein